MKSLIKDLFRTSRLRKNRSNDIWHKVSYSQCGEDLIVSYIFSSLNISMPSYLDIGAYHPYKFSNTARFYKQGSHGINIEPDPVLFKKIVEARPDDINLNIGIRSFQGSASFYLLSAPTLNTFRKGEAEQLVKEHGLYIKDVKSIQVDTLPNIIDSYAGGVFPDFFSLDAEGVDIEILESIDYSGSLPKVLCVETISYSTNGQGEKDREIIDLLEDKGYLSYADTYINTIFVRKDIWKR